MDRTEIHIQTQDPHPSTSNILEIERPHSQENHAMDIEMDIEEHLCEELSLQHDDNRESHVDYEEVPPADEGDWVIKYRNLEHKYMELLQRHKKCKQRYSKLENDKLSSDDYALRVGKELMQLKDKQHMPQTRFTVDDDINITVEELDEFNARADTDSMFVGLLATRLVGSDALAKMSVTGQVSHRFGKLKNPDGTPKYPAAERLDPLILEFIGNKVAERTAIKVGCQNIPTIRKRSDIALVKRYIAQKIANLRKAAQVRNARAGTGPVMVALPPTAADAALHHC
nr:uncharacterized protein LOC109427596 isoform X1 [Aedes albopictus]